MELIGRISKGSKMDQIYLPKNRTGFASGEYVIILPLQSKLQEKQKKEAKEYLYGIKSLEPIKLGAIKEIFALINKHLNTENIVITGSFLELGFKFNDIDILIINEQKSNLESLEKQIENSLGIRPHIIQISQQALLSGLSTDPLYSLMLSKCISRNRLIFKAKRKINYKMLDLHLLKSKVLIDNFDILSGDEKYYFTLNLVSILLFIQNKKVSKEIVNKEIETLFGISVDKIKDNLISKKEFIKKYKKIYDKTFNLIMGNIKNEQK